MERISRFGFYELLFTGINLIISKLFLVYLHGYTTYGSSSAALISIYVSMLGGLYFLFFCCLQKRFPQKSFPEIIEASCSTTVKKLFYLCLILFIIINQSIYIEAIIKCIRLSVLPDYSEITLYVFCYFAVFFSILCGIKSIVRIHAVIMPLIAFFVLFLIPGNIKNFDYTNFLPVFGNGIEGFFHGTFLVSFFSDMIYLLFLTSYGRKDINSQKLIFSVYTISSIVLVTLVTLYTLIIGTEDIQIFLPVFRISQYADYSNIMADIEAFFAIGWILSFFMNISVSLYVACKLTGELYGAKSLKPFFAPLCTLPFILSYFMQRKISLEESINIMTIPKIAVTMLLPLTLLIYANIKKGFKKSK